MTRVGSFPIRYGSSSATACAQVRARPSRIGSPNPTSPSSVWILRNRERGLTRSEERRVGEEGRSRGAPDHLKKKKRNSNVFRYIKNYMMLRKIINDVLLGRQNILSHKITLLAKKVDSIYTYIAREHYITDIMYV